MAREIQRIGIYWFPPKPLAAALTDTWEGHHNRDQACALVARHCGDCPVWGPHATLLDAVSILADDRLAFVSRAKQILSSFLPLTLSAPTVSRRWAPNVFIHWKQDKQWRRLRDLRVALMDGLRDFVVVEPVSWEVANDLGRLVEALGSAVKSEFARALEQVQEHLRQRPPKLIHAPNVPLEWYVAQTARGRTIRSGRLPFPSTPHISIATAVRRDEPLGWSAGQVTDHITEKLPESSAWSDVVGPSLTHQVNAAHIVEPASSRTPPLSVTVLDRLTGQPRAELRQPWVPKERLP